MSSVIIYIFFVSSKCVVYTLQVNLKDMVVAGGNNESGSDKTLKSFFPHNLSSNYFFITGLQEKENIVIEIKYMYVLQQ